MADVLRDINDAIARSPRPRATASRLIQSYGIVLDDPGSDVSDEPAGDEWAIAQNTSGLL